MPQEGREPVQPVFGIRALKVDEIKRCSEVAADRMWAEPNFVQPRSHSVSQAQAGPLVDLLSGVVNLGAETMVLVGALKKADVDNGTWRIATNEGDIAGKTKQGGPSLAGLKLESLYRFTCLEELEESESGREQRIIYLTEHEPV